jgi:hypothetical protein
MSEPPWKHIRLHNSFVREVPWGAKLVLSEILNREIVRLFFSVSFYDYVQVCCTDVMEASYVEKVIN